MDMLMYLQKTQDGEMLACKKCDATHVRLPKVTYEALMNGDYLNVKQKINAARIERSGLETILEIIDPPLRRCYEEHECMDMYLMTVATELEKKTGEFNY